MPNYITAVNQLICSAALKVPNVCLYGPNINNGTFISGLSKNLKAPEGGKLINVHNCENTLCGVGFGMMLSGVNSVYFVKQLDFMLLGMDHFVNTYNFIRCSRDLTKLGSYSIIMFICDQGVQGPQSSFNSFGDFSSLARIPCYTLTNSHDATTVLNTQLTAPGFRLIALSSRLCRTEFLSLNAIYSAPDSSVFQYSDGADVTIVCYNYSLFEGVELQKKLKEQNLSSSLFSVNYVPEPALNRIKESVARTRKLVVMDDSKSVHLPAYQLINAIAAEGTTFKKIVLTRNHNINFGMTDDKFPVDYNDVLEKLRETECSPVRS